MKTVRVVNNVVVETIPEAATIPSVAHWYGDDFAAECVEAPDEVMQDWKYDPASNSFSEPTYEPSPVPPMDAITMTQLALTELAETQEASQTTTEIALAELAELIAGGGN